jgi:pyruvate dehydrogenase (quinone)
MAEPPRVVADLLVERLRAWHVPRVFGFPGYAVEGIVSALGRAGGEPDFVQVRHEAAAGFMATGHAKYSGGVGVCLATQGPGAVHLLNGLYDAKLDNKPVVAIVGQQSASPLGAAHLDIELHRLFSDVCAQFVRTAIAPEQVAPLLDQAFRTAVATRSPTCLVLPYDLQVAAVPDPLPHPDGVISTVAGLPPARVVPHDEELDAAAQLLGSGRRVAILVGQGAYGAADEIIELADRVGAGIATSLLGKPVLDERLPFHTGVMGHLGTTASGQLMGGCDTLVLIGTNNPWTDFYPLPGQASAIQIDIDGRRVGTRYPVDVPLIGDAALTLRALLPRVPHRQNRDWREMIEGSVDRWREEAVERVEAPAQPVNPQRVLYELSPRMPRDGAVAVDVGTVTYWYARHLQVPPGVTAHLCGTLGSMGCALSYGIAAKLAAPDRPVIALTGDGAMQMTGLAELISIAQRWPRWADPRFVVLVLNNRNDAALGQETLRGSGAPTPSPDGMSPVDVPYAGWAQLLGLHAVRVDRPDQIGPAWDEALAATRPTLIEAVVDPSIQLQPPDQPFADLRGLIEEGDPARRVRDQMLREQAVDEAQAAEDLL